MQKIKIFFKQHYAAFIFAILIGIVIVFPNFLFIYQAGNQYKGFNMFETDAEYYYIARIREVYDGHYKLSNPILSAGKDLPYLQPPLPELIMGFTGKALNLNVSQTLILYRFIAPALIFLLIYFLVLSATDGDKKSAILAPLVVILAADIIFSPGQIISLLQGQVTSTQFLGYTRPVNPQISSLVFFAFLYSFWKLMQSPARRYLYYCIALFGLSFYVYPYTWSFIAAFLAIYGLLLLWQKQRTEFKKVILLTLGAFILALPYFFNVYQLLTHPSYQDSVNAYGEYESHEFVFSGLLLLAAAGLVLYYWLGRQKAKNFVLFFFALVSAGFVAINQQVVTGRVLYYGHYHWYINKPLAIIILFMVVMMVLRHLPFKRLTATILLIVVIFVSFLNGYLVQMNSYAFYFKRNLDAQKYFPVIKWLNENASADQVVYAPGGFSYPGMASRTLSKLILTYTPLNLYYYSETHYYLSPYPDYGLYNLFITLKLLGIEPDKSFAFLRAEPNFFKDIYHNYYKVRGLTYDDLDSVKIENAVAKYREFYSLDWREIFSKYPFDYVVWDSVNPQANDLPFGKIAAEENIFETVYNQDGVIIYKFLHQ